MTELIGYIAAFLTTASFLPQAIQTIKSRDTSGISFWMYLMFVVGVAFWLAYGVMLGNWVIVSANIITFVLAGMVLLVKTWNYYVRKPSLTASQDSCGTDLSTKKIS